MEQQQTTSGKCSLYIVLAGAAFVIWLWFSGKQHNESKPPAERCLSAWDGSHGGMVSATKAIMKDPGSFEHVETRYIDRGQEVDLIMTFRGRNGFGGLVLNTSKATINKDCDLIAGPVIL